MWCQGKLTNGINRTFDVSSKVKTILDLVLSHRNFVQSLFLWLVCVHYNLYGETWNHITKYMCDVDIVYDVEYFTSVKSMVQGQGHYSHLD